MRRSRSLLVVFSLSLMAVFAFVSFTAPSAANASTHPSNASRTAMRAVSHMVPGGASKSRMQALERYWTPARLRAAAAHSLTRGALPLPPGRSAASANREAFATGPHLRTLARPAAAKVPANRPASRARSAKVGPDLATPATIGRVFFYDPADGYNASCSGGTINNPTGDMVFTAGHCVNNGDLVWMQDWVYVPAYYYGQAPFGMWEATDMTAMTSWVLGGDFNYDVGVVNVFNPYNPFTLVQTTGGNGLDWDSSDCYCYMPDVWPWGYPAENGFNGQDAWYCVNGSTSVLFTEDVTQLITWCAPLDNGGSSGGPWFADFSTSSLLGYEDGLTSTNVPGSPDFVGSPYFGSFIETLYDATAYN